MKAQDCDLKLLNLKSLVGENDEFLYQHQVAVKCKLMKNALFPCSVQSNLLHRFTIKFKCRQFFQVDQ